MPFRLDLAPLAIDCKRGEERVKYSRKYNIIHGGFGVCTCSSSFLASTFKIQCVYVYYLESRNNSISGSDDEEVQGITLNMFLFV